MNKISPLSLFVSVATLIFLGGFWYAIMPQLKNLGELYSEQEVLQEDPIVTALSIRRKVTENNLTETKKQAELLLPAEDNQYDLSVQIEGLAKRLGLPLTGLILTQTESTQGQAQTTGGPPPVASIAADKITITIGVSGEYATVQQFVSSLPTLERFIQIDQVTLSKAGEDAATSAQITAFAYYLPGAASSN